jgi:hypothetical protein
LIGVVAPPSIQEDYSKEDIEEDGGAITSDKGRLVSDEVFGLRIGKFIEWAVQ